VTAQRLIRSLAGRWTLLMPVQLAGGRNRCQDHLMLWTASPYESLIDTLRRAKTDGPLSAWHLIHDDLRT
jgi:hypothetical protein